MPPPQGRTSGVGCTYVTWWHTPLTQKGTQDYLNQPFHPIATRFWTISSWAVTPTTGFPLDVTWVDESWIRIRKGHCCRFKCLARLLETGMPASGIFSDVQGQEPRSFDFCPGPWLRQLVKPTRNTEVSIGVFRSKEFGWILGWSMCMIELPGFSGKLHQTSMCLCGLSGDASQPAAGYSDMCGDLPRRLAVLEAVGWGSFRLAKLNSQIDMI